MKAIESITELHAGLLTLSPQLRAEARAMEDARRLPAELAHTMARLGVFRIMLPTDVGGLQLPLVESVKILESLAHANASAGWCAMIGATTAITSAFFDRETAAEIYADPLTITGGAFAPTGRATAHAEDFCLTGRWAWGSGSANCGWLCAGALVTDGGTLRVGPDGTPENRLMFFRANEASLIDTWHVAGLQGTGSGDFAVDGITVPRRRTLVLSTARPQVDGALYRFPIFGLLALGVATVAMGNSRGALDSLRQRLHAPPAPGTTSSKADRATVQTVFAEAEAQWRSARAYLLDEVHRAWDAAQNRAAIAVEQRTSLRLACTTMTRRAADVCRTAYELGGGAALYSDHDLQRRFRDAYAITQHIVTAPSTYELLGRLLLDRPTNTTML